MEEKESKPKEPKKAPPAKKAKSPKADRTYKLEGVLYPEGMELSSDQVKIFDRLKCTYIT